MNETEGIQIEKYRQIGSVFKSFIKWGAIAVIAYFVYLSIAALAGLETFASILVDVSAKGTAVTNVVSEQSIELGTTAAGKFRSDELATYGILFITNLLFFVLYKRERSLRLNKTESLSHHIESLEKLLDPNRTSSELTRRGTTNPEDM